MKVPQTFGRPLKAIIDRAAFQHNIARVESIASNSQVVVVIKADAYGHGLIEMAQAAGQRDLAVATADEACDLVHAGITNRIWVLEGPLSAQCLTLNNTHQIVWTIHSDWQLNLIESNTASTAPLKCWLKLDTGMHRLGFSAETDTALMQRLNDLSHDKIELIGSMVHFASSDQPENATVYAQLAAFNERRTKLGLADLPISLSNSGAVLYYPQAHGDWVRPGIMLYGGMPDPQSNAKEAGLKPVMRFTSEIIALREIDAGEAVGYGGRWTAQKKSTIATVACGYGDGYPRSAPNGTPVWLNEQRAPLIGTVSMDMLAIDVSDVEAVAIGDEVELWGEHIPVDEVALAAGTISYELLTRVTKRVPRVYL